jgi:DNA-binding FadR family transcriptional regulator
MLQGNNSVFTQPRAQTVPQSSRQLHQDALIGSKLVQHEAGVPKLVSTTIASSLRTRIEAGEWRQSRRLPDERTLAAQYGVARNTLRAAIDRIAADGLLVREAGRGNFLRPSAQLDLAALIDRLSGVSPVDMMAVRQILEPRAAALAATNASAGDLDAIAAAHEAAIRAEDMEGFERWDAAFHQRIFAGSRIELLDHLHQILSLIRDQDLWVQIKRRSFSPARRRAYCDEHAAIAQALRHRDAAAAEAAMRAHLDTVGRNLFAGADPFPLA